MTVSIESIMATYEAADETVRLAGAQWYDDARAFVAELAEESGYSCERVAIAMAHLSPRISYLQNKRATRVLVLDGERTEGFATNWLKARNALIVDDPWSTFSKRAPKTRAFARAILGDEDAVVIDVWASRVVGVDPDELRRVGRYDEVADAYRKAAAQLSVSPRDLQAITWVQTRGRAA